MSDKQRIPVETTPPGEFIRDELETRGWTQAELAFILGRPQPTVNAIIAGRKAITPETAKGLANAFGTSADFWLNLESAYRLSRVKQTGDDAAVARRAFLLSLAPIKDMVKRQWVSDTEEVGVLEGELKAFFETESLETDPQLCAAARMTSNYAGLTVAQRAWMCRAKKLARAVSAAPFRQDVFVRGLNDLRKLISSDHDVRRVPRFLADLGVRLVLIEHLPKTRIDGATIWLDKNTPAVALSLRFDRIDGFWFTLCHELSHVRHGDGKGSDAAGGWRLDDGLIGEPVDPNKPDFEMRADREAAEFLVPKQEIEKFIVRVRPLYSKTKIVHFANRIKVHPGIIVGQLQRRQEITYAQNREFLTKVRESLMPATLSDGWGFTPPLR